ncbi:MAG: lytic murein transglycosylase B [Gammaproteobacteria bacterium]|nr:lytic murein transglycosylase B [Gammaproteobacteria bacterium]MCY4282993.1 lytic murein transglycosylase B [Gammaproteobacteria bacterium]MCY4337169.1 lytic murein transglycosylase B [Gammaproteobacteria bacterium]
MKSRITIAGCLLLAFSHAGAELLQRAEVATFIDEMVAEHDYDATQLEDALAGVQLSEKIIAAITRPAEALPWHRYRSIFLKPARIKGGATFWRQHQAQLERAAQTYGVPIEIMVAVIGVETKYGGNTGGFKVINALSTLAFDYPKRSRFFTSELKHYFLLTRDQSLDPHQLTGSYAGAMGIPQFMPSSYRAYAVDFDGDGLTDIWDNPADAIGSVGNYLGVHGWQADAGIVSRARVPEGDISALLTKGLELQLRMEQVAAAGVAVDAEVDPAEQVKLLQLENKDGFEYWLACQNFYVITRYNRSTLYAMAVYQLAQAIRAEYEAGP